MRRTWTVAALAVGAAVILAAAFLGQGWLRNGSATSEAEVEQAELTRISAEGRAGDDVIVRGNWGQKYLSSDELDLLNVDVELDRVKRRVDYELGQWGVGCRQGLDCIVAITDPTYEPVESADEWLSGKHFVLSVRFSEDDVRAYPLNLLSYHEIVNDTVGGTPVAITYCPLCHSGVAFRRPSLDGEPLEFRVSGRLYNANLLMVDRQTGTFWNQIQGQAVAGPLLGRAGTLIRIPTSLSFWEDWKAAHPDGQVISRPEEVQGLRGTRSIAAEEYRSSPYGEYMMRPGVGFGVDTQRMDLRDVASKRLVYGVEFEDVTKAYLDGTFEDVGLIHDVVGDRPVLVTRTPKGEVRAFERTHPDHQNGQAALTFERRDSGSGWRDVQTGTVWSEDGRPVEGPLAETGTPLEEVEVLASYWFAWLLFHPDTEIYRGSE